ncbi:MAG: hypothetical protein NUV80_01660 [Candidatus Berkelbacteria bacterium]|nr:hypothetical protein [Candidatus Berkelbacteria bacterium]MCR4307246.1 hypothetical protein [Candidatus Berkelbacteria bacterium]
MKKTELIDPQYVIDVCARHQLFIRGIISHKPAEPPSRGRPAGTKGETHTLIRLYATNDEEEDRGEVSLIECVYSFTETVDGEDSHYPLRINAGGRMTNQIREEKLRSMIVMWQEREDWKKVSKGCWFDRVPIAIQIMDESGEPSDVVTKPHGFDFLHQLHRLHSLILTQNEFHWAKAVLARRVKGAIKEFEKPWRQVLG